MKNNFILAFALFILASAVFSSALNVDITIPIPTNSSTYNVNNSLCWQGHCTPNDGSWLTGIVYSETDPKSLHLNKDNWFGDSWITYTNPNFIFNESKLATIYYNVTQSNIVKGTIDGGTLANTQHQDGKYDGVTFNFSEASGSPALDLRINFTGITSFTNGVMRYKTSSLAGDYPIIQLWNYDTSSWEDYPAVAQSSNFATITQPVFDSSEHVSGGIVQMRLYKASNGNTNNHYYVDWIAISKGYGTPAGEEVDPLSFHKNQNLNNSEYNITTDYFFGDGSQLTGISTYNVTYAGLINNASYLSTYNSTYNTWAYNQTFNSTGYAQYQFGSNNFNGSGNVTAGTVYIGSTPNTGMVHPLQISGNLGTPRSSIIRRDIGTTIPKYTGVWNVNTIDNHTVGYIDVTATGATKGGMQITGFTGSDTTATTIPLLMGGVIGTASPGATQPTMVFRGGKWDGSTGVSSIGTAGVLAVWRNWATDVLTIYGNGDIITTGKGTFGSTYQAILGDELNGAGYFYDGVYSVNLVDGGRAAYFGDGLNEVYLLDGTYAINAVGNSLFTGNVDVTGNIDVATISVSATPGIDATIPLAPDTTVGETTAGSMTFTQGILTYWTPAT